MAGIRSHGYLSHGCHTDGHGSETDSYPRPSVWHPWLKMFKKMRYGLYSMLAAALLLSGCGDRPTRLEDVNATILTLPDGSRIVAETMIQELDTTRGMMFRDALAPGRGMIMIYPKEEKHPAFT